MTDIISSSQARVTAEHSIDVDAPARDVFALLADVEGWPTLFPPTVHVECLSRSGLDERIQLWATTQGAAKTWTSHRRVAPAEGRIDFRQERSMAPVAEMGGAWIVEPRNEWSCTVRLLHNWRAVGDEPEALRWIDAAVERNSGLELAALKAGAERGNGADALLTFEDTVEIAGPPAAVHAFVRDAHRWEERLPHVAAVRLEESSPGVQVLAMDTRTTDGSTHTTESVRVCLDDRILYKQTRVPALMTLHTGEWTFVPTATGTLATSRHTVAVNTTAITSVLGPDAGIERARTFIRTALGANSTATLEQARRHVEDRQDGPSSP